MTVKSFYRQIADRLGERVQIHVTISADYVTIAAVVPGGTVVETITQTPDVWSRTRTSAGRAHYVVDVWDSHDVEAAVPHLLTLIDDVAGLVVS